MSSFVVPISYSVMNNGICVLSIISCRYFLMMLMLRQFVGPEPVDTKSCPCNP